MQTKVEENSSNDHYSLWVISSNKCGFNCYINGNDLQIYTLSSCLLISIPIYTTSYITCISKHWSQPSPVKLVIKLLILVTFQGYKLDTSWLFLIYYSSLTHMSVVTYFNSINGLSTIRIYPFPSVYIISSLMWSLHIYYLDCCNSILLCSSC